MTLFSAYEPIARDLEQVTGIYQRHDLLLAIDLTFHSALKFNFLGRPVIKGWVEMLVLGDTRTGKTASVQGMMNHYQLGEMGTGESSSFAGLIGGLSQVNKRWNVQWGKIPLNDRRLFVIDEVSGLEVDDIALMSGVRSTGVAELTKIQMERTRARTRLIWISNPRRANPLSSYTYGVLAVKELIGRPEDISRFDIVITSASWDVESNIYNTRPKNNKIKFDSSSCRNLILWIWSRTPEQIIIQKDTEIKILEYAEIQGKKYNSSIPVVEAAEQRIKLAKLSVAIAARFFSTDDGENLIVKPIHADFAFEFLEYCYGKNSMRYDEWSKKQNEQFTLKNPEFLKSIIPPDTVEMFMDSEVLNLSDIEDMVGDRGLAKRMIKHLRKQRALHKVSGSYYKKTPAFIQFLRDVQIGKVALDFEGETDTGDSGNEMPF